MNEGAQGMWNLYLMELTNRWTKMQELSSIFIKPNFALHSAWLLVRQSPSWTKEGCWVFMSSCCSLVVFFSFPYKRLVDSKYSRRSKDLLKEFHHHFFICCSHPCLTRIRFQGSNGMDPRHACHYFIFSIFFQEWYFLFLFIKRYLSLFIVVHQISILNKAGIKLAQIGRSILTTYSQCTLERWHVLFLHVVQFLMTCLPRLCFSPAWTWGLTHQILRISCRG